MKIGRETDVGEKIFIFIRLLITQRLLLWLKRSPCESDSSPMHMTFTITGDQSKYCEQNLTKTLCKPDSRIYKVYNRCCTI